MAKKSDNSAPANVAATVRRILEVAAWTLSGDELAAEINRVQIRGRWGKRWDLKMQQSERKRSSGTSDGTADFENRCEDPKILHVGDIDS